MQVKSVFKNTGVSPRKVRLVVDLVRGKKVNEALDLLKFTPTPSARLVSKAVKSAAANAENNYQLLAADLKIVRITADAAPTLKRHRARSRGRVSPILKRSSNITVIVDELEA
jgi:large subunit ribosomal protein L22